MNDLPSWVLASTAALLLAAMVMAGVRIVRGPHAAEARGAGEVVPADGVDREERVRTEHAAQRAHLRLDLVNARTGEHLHAGVALAHERFRGIAKGHAGRTLANRR